MRTLDQLKPGESGIIKEFAHKEFALKLIEMGCLPGNVVELIQIAPFGDPLYLNINGAHVAIRLETACEIEVDILQK